ncbi:MAG: glycosyltransferase [Proteobacteria bacterium]|nr:glycosyltransferase [Pseudomonadota bacterium]
MLKRFPRLSETFIVHELLELERQGLEIDVFALSDPADPVQHEALQRLRARVTYLPRDDWTQAAYICSGSYARGRGAGAPTAEERARTWTRQTLVGRHAADWEQATLMLKAGALAALARARGVDHLHAHFASDAATVARLASRMTGLPYSFTAHAKDIYHDTVDAVLLQQKLRDAAFVVTVCEHNRRHLARLAGRAAKRVKLIYNGVDLRLFRPELEPGQSCSLDTQRSLDRQAWLDRHGGGGKNGGLILGVGRLVEKKGFHFLLEACRMLHERGVGFRCAIVGQGELREELSRRIDDVGLRGRVRLVGACSQDELRGYYRQAALLVMPCVIAEDGNRDALPTVMLEAMASGLPVVATRVTGNPEIVEHGHTGFIVGPERADELAAATASLLAEPGLRMQLGNAGRRRAETRFDLRENVGRLRRLFLPQGSSLGVA